MTCSKIGSQNYRKYGFTLTSQYELILTWSSAFLYFKALLTNMCCAKSCTFNVYFLYFYLFITFIYKAKKQKEIFHLLIHSPKCPQQQELGQPGSPKFNLSLPCNSSTWTITWCFQRWAEAQSWDREWSQDLIPKTSIWSAGTPVQITLLCQCRRSGDCGHKRVSTLWCQSTTRICYLWEPPSCSRVCLFPWDLACWYV